MYGDGSVTVLFLPGHSQGSVVIRVAGRDGFALLVGDTDYNCDSWEKLKLPGPVYDREAMKSSLEWVQNMRRNPRCLGVFAAHDPEEKRQIIEIQEDDAK